MPKKGYTYSLDSNIVERFVQAAKADNRSLSNAVEEAMKGYTAAFESAMEEGKEK